MYTCYCNQCMGQQEYTSRRTLSRHKRQHGVPDNLDQEGYYEFIAGNPELMAESNLDIPENVVGDDENAYNFHINNNMDLDDEVGSDSGTFQDAMIDIDQDSPAPPMDHDHSDSEDSMYVDHDNVRNNTMGEVQVNQPSGSAIRPASIHPESPESLHHTLSPEPHVPHVDRDYTEEEYDNFAAELDEDLCNAAREQLALDPDSVNDDAPGDLETDEEGEPVYYAQMSRIENVKLAQEYIKAVSQATLDNGGLNADTITSLRDPEETLYEILEDPITRLSIDLYLSCSSASLATYNNVRDAYLRNMPESAPLSLHRVQKAISSATGIVDVRDDMCINSCHAFTGPLASLDHCKECNEPRYHPGIFERTGKRIPRKQACTILLGPQLQALRRSPAAAQAMLYQHEKTREIVEAIEAGILDLPYDDIFSGDDYIELIGRIGLTEDDTSVLFSLDGAQLYRNRKSDTWLAIWIIANYDPQMRYRKTHVLPALVVPGPNKPKNIDSFTFRGFHHLSALQREVNDGVPGIRVWDAVKGAIVSSRVLFLLGTADAVALTELDGRVGHHGAQGCRIGCTMVGRHKPSTGHYHAAHLQPIIDGELSGHPDFDFRHKDAYNHPTPENYQESIVQLAGSRTQAAYERNRLVTGLSKPSILTGLKHEYMLRVPQCFSVDLMHLLSLNLGELFIPLWTANTTKIRCQRPDSTAHWDWATLKGDIWEEHGKLIAAATKYFPSSFHRPPRNPVEKINSGYKATEYHHYLFSLGPGFFRTVLPDIYWCHFCKLIRAVHIVTKRRITLEEIKEAHALLIQFVEEFELLYYKRLLPRLHFCRPCLHTLLHLAQEILRIGPGCYFTQYTMERAIGDFGKGIRQPSNPFANLCQVTVRYGQKNAMKALYPDLAPTTSPFPKSSIKFNSYSLLQPRDRTLHKLSGDERHAIDISLIPETNRVQRWGRLKLPNGQVARSRRSEDYRKAENIRISRNIKIKRTANAQVEFGEVQFYFIAASNDQDHEDAEDDHHDSDAANNRVAYALVSLYGNPDAALLESSHKTLWAAKYQGSNAFDVVPISAIISVVSMQPLPKKPGDEQDLWFVAEKLGLDDMDILEDDNED